jgi:plastocyanin
MTKIFRVLVPIPALVLLSATTACQSSSTPPPPAVTGGGKTVDAATAGSIAGRVTFTGTPPAPEMLKMASDPACVQASGPNVQSDAVLISADGALQNAFVYIKSGLDPAYSFDTPTATVELDQSGCRYAPRIVGVRVGQPIEIVNDDSTLHNVHALPMVNQEFNKGQPMQGMRERHVFTAPEAMVRIKCDVHGWMTAYVGVMSHPFFAVTGADGSFALRGVPPGTYEVEAWHEKFGTRTAQVTVAANQAQTASFAFGG